MARTKTSTAKRRTDRWLREGRGQGEGASYKPYLTIRDVPSAGRSHRDVHLSGGRTTHLLSDLEQRFVTLACWSLPVRDLREQFPLPLDSTLAIAAECGYHHPRDRRTKAITVVTTDVVLTLETEAGPRDLACSIKYAHDLGDARTLEKLEIERRWWEMQVTPWILLTEHEISRPFAENVHRLQNYVQVDDRVSLTARQHAILVEELTSAVIHQHEPLNRAVDACDERLGVVPGTSLTIAYHLLATHQWPADLREALDLSQPLRLLPAPGH